MAVLFNDSFRAKSDRWRNGEAKCLGRIRVDYEFEFRGALNWNIAGLAPLRILSTNTATRRYSKRKSAP
jgi:hypothetical protein